MDATQEQKTIIRTVIAGFFPKIKNPTTFIRITNEVFNVVEGRASNATARTRIFDILDPTGRDPIDDGVELCINTANSLACGCRSWLQDVGTEIRLDVYPAFELHQAYTRNENVDWMERWQGNSGQIFQDGRMIALKNDPIWVKVSEFGLPFPPYDLDSGMRIENVLREDAEDFGLLKRNATIQVPVGYLVIDFEKALKRRLREYFSGDQAT